VIPDEVEVAPVELNALFGRSVNGWTTAVANATGDWSAPTPCAEWNVRELVNHVVGEDRWTKPLVDRRTIADVGDSLDGDLLGDDAHTAAHAAADEAIAAVTEQLPIGGVVHLSYGDEAIEEYIRQLVADHLIHGWDLAAATGQDRTLDPEVVHAVSTWYGEREKMYRSGGAVAPRPAGVAGGDAQSDLLIAFGRDPSWSG